MNTVLIVIAFALVVGIIVFFKLFISWGIRWRATAEECSMQMTGDSCLEGGPATRVFMTRAISINKPPKIVWPWLAQLGRGAGWYSIDRLDNGGKISARHIVSWIPTPQLGDASAIGYLRYIEPERELVWWSNGDQQIGANFRVVMDFNARPEKDGTRLVMRTSTDAAGPTAKLIAWIFQFVDTIMARQLLLGVKERVEQYGARADDPDQPESGLRDQYQLYETIYASGERAGVGGKEKAPYWRQTAIEDKIIENPK